MTDEYKEPPNLCGKELRFDQFHPLDHWPWQCGDLYGGWRNHLEMTWSLRRKPALRAMTYCKVGRHRRTQMWGRDRNSPPGRMTWTRVVCLDCGKPLSKKQAI